MDLWIRSSQRKNFIPINNGLYIEEIDATISKKGNFEIRAIQSNGYTPLGDYKTEERALEVLDEIQSMTILNMNICNTDYENADLKIKAKVLEMMVKVYEMPKE